MNQNRTVNKIGGSNIYKIDEVVRLVEYLKKK